MFTSISDLKEAQKILGGTKDRDIIIALSGGYGPKIRNETVRLIRILAPKKEGVID